MLGRYTRSIDDHDAAAIFPHWRACGREKKGQSKVTLGSTDDDGAGAAMASEAGEWRRGKGRAWRLVEEGIAGGAASAAACLASNPIDGIRCRQQLKTRPPILGTSTLQAGLAPAMAYNIVLNSTRFSLYCALHDEESKISSSLLGPVASGVLAGGIAGFISSPLARWRTLRQAGDSLSSARSFLLDRPFEGAVPWAARNAGHTACIFPLFAIASKRLDASWADAPQTVRHLVASLFAASVSCMLMNPLDVYCTRLYHGGSQLSAAYRSSLIGSLLAGYRGLSANLLRTVPHTVLTFVLLERWRSLSSSDPATRSSTTTGNAAPAPAAANGLGRARTTAVGAPIVERERA